MPSGNALYMMKQPEFTPKRPKRRCVAEQCQRNRTIVAWIIHDVIQKTCIPQFLLISFISLMVTEKNIEYFYFEKTV